MVNSPLSIVIPVLDERPHIAARLAALAPARAQGTEVIVVDGGSKDGTLEAASALCDRVIEAPRGRAAQMNAGAAQAAGDILLFLHADTSLPPDVLRLIGEALAGGRAWGRFDVEIEGRSRLLPLVAALMNERSALTGIVTGDQAMFVRRVAFEAVGGFPDIPLMEDIAISRALKRIGRPARVRARVRTSGRRWDERGALRTIALMWRLRMEYFFGAHPNALALRYGYRPREDA